MVSDKVLRERRKEALDKAEAIVTLCKSENERGMTEEEDKDFQAQIAEATRLAGELEGLARATSAAVWPENSKDSRAPRRRRRPCKRPSTTTCPR